jgi:hypothetical protein
MCLLTGKRDQICGGNVLKKYMKEIWAHSRDPYDASCFVRITKCNFFYPFD